MKYIFILFLLAIGFRPLAAQNLEYGAQLDTTYMLIGDQQHFTMQVLSDQDVRVKFPQLKDTISQGIEIISGPVRDSVKEKNGKWLFRESYVITAFDTGVYVVPAMPITVESDQYNNVVRTEPLAFVVNTYKVDEQKGNYDIVMPYQTPLNFAEVFPYVLWGLLGLGLILLLIWYILRLRKNKPLFVHEKTVIPPYVKAVSALDRLKEEKLWQSGRVKDYYTRLTDTVRQYLDEELQIGAMEQTSFETMQELAQCPLVEKNDREQLEAMFRTADFVKFAKSTPLPDENARNLNIAYDFLNHTNARLQSAQTAAQEQEEKEKNPEITNHNE